jgi:hypothetical protein
MGTNKMGRRESIRVGIMRNNKPNFLHFSRFGAESTWQVAMKVLYMMPVDYTRIVFLEYNEKLGSFSVQPLNLLQDHHFCRASKMMWTLQEPCFYGNIASSNLDGSRILKTLVYGAQKKRIVTN